MSTNQYQNASRAAAEDEAKTSYVILKIAQPEVQLPLLEHLPGKRFKLAKSF